MIDSIPVAADDRLLLLSIPAPEIVTALARRLSRGLLVGLGGIEEVSAARRAARDLLNVMFLAAPPGEIPWQDGFFSRAIEPRGVWPELAAARETARVLAAGAFFHIAGSGGPPESPPPGFVLVGRAAGVTTLRRQD